MTLPFRASRKENFPVKSRRILSQAYVSSFSSNPSFAVYLSAIPFLISFKRASIRRIKHSFLPQVDTITNTNNQASHPDTTMCHSIIWYHVLCGHTDHSMSPVIYCDEAILSGKDCLPCVDRINFPMIGLCDSCMAERRRLKARRCQEMQASASHARPTRTDASEAAKTDTDSRVHIAKSHGCGTRYNGWHDKRLTKPSSFTAWAW